MNEVEFSRMVRTDTIGATPRSLQIEAGPTERAALARRFGLGGIERLMAEVELSKSLADIVATGRVEAEVTQSCVVTGEPLPARIDEPFTVRFRPPPELAGSEEEIELADEEMDVTFVDGGLVDIGEAVAQTLALNLDPYPRAPQADTALEQAGIRDESEAGPFGALAALKDRLGK